MRFSIRMVLVRLLAVASLAPAGVFLTVFNASAGTMTLPGTGFDANGNALGNFGVDANWTVSGAPYGSAAYVVTPGDPDWPNENWPANTASNGWLGSSWINDNNEYGGGGSVLPYTYSMSFSLARFQLNNDLQISGFWAIDDTGTLGINGNTIEIGTDYGFPNGFPLTAYSLSYAANPTWFNPGTNVITIEMTGSDNYMDGVRLQGAVTGDAATLEPSTLALLAASAVVLAAHRFRRRRAARRTANLAPIGHNAPAILSFPSHSPPASAARRAA